MHESIVIQRPAAETSELVLLFHGVGATADDLVPLGSRVAQARPQAMVVSVNAPDPSTLGRGREWFSVVGVTEENRPARVAEAMSAFQDTVAHWQRQAGLAPAATTLVGFSQGAIMSLESLRHTPAVAGRVVALAGRLASPLVAVHGGQVVHVIHGEQDPVIPVRHGIDAAQALERVGARVTLDVLPGLGHGVDARVAALLTERLSG